MHPVCAVAAACAVTKQLRLQSPQSSTAALCELCAARRLGAVSFAAAAAAAATATRRMAAGEDDEGRLEARREAELRAARRKLSKFVVDHERHNLKPDDAKMKRMHAEIKRIEGTVQVRSSGTARRLATVRFLSCLTPLAACCVRACAKPIRDSVDWLENNGYAEAADRVVLGLEKAGYPCSTWLREVSSMKRADLLAFAEKYTASLEAKEDQSKRDHEKDFAVTTGASGKAAMEQEARRQRMAVSGGLHVEGTGSRYQEWKKAEKRAKQAEKDQQRAQAEQDAKFRAGMMLKMRKSKAQKNIVEFKNLKEGFSCDARDRWVDTI